MDKQRIIAEIKRIAFVNGGKAPGQQLFLSETGIKQHEWRGKFWARWGDALREAGYAPNEWIESYEESFLLEKFISLMRELGQFPTTSELGIKSHNDPSFPSAAPFRRLGSKQKLAAKILEYSQNRTGYEDVAALCAKIPTSSSISESKSKTEEIVGFVYLIKSGRYYKIGRSVSVGQRERQLAIQLPDKTNTVHSIRTDDPVGIEAYWHSRFAQKRKNGEWFDLSSQEVSAFKRRKFM